MALQEVVDLEDILDQLATDVSDFLVNNLVNGRAI
jgi:hypothetical protein